jgi:hypothetical protein
MGDGGGAGDPQNNAQNTQRLLGKMLRLDVSGDTGYAIPTGNPFASQPRCSTGVGTAACPEIYALGLRNPWRFSFDRDTGQLWVGDVGQGAWEEIDRVVAGGNYGWRFREGAHCYTPSTGCPTTQNGAPLIDPVAEYDHGVGQSVTGGYVYRGSANPGLAGSYLFADFISGRIFAHEPGSGNIAPTVLTETTLSISAVAEDRAGEIYAVDYGGGLYRIDEVPGSGGNTIPAMLSATGCVDTEDATQPAGGLIPYAPQAGSGSDAATTSRWIGLPDGENIIVGPDDDWDLPPPRTVLVQNLTLGDRRVETRLLMRHPDGIWAGYTYEWNDAQTEATRVVGGKTRVFGSQEWLYPSESNCLQCHTGVADRTLGLESGQLNGDLTYSATGRTANQLVTLNSIGVLGPPLPDDVSTLPHFADRATCLRRSTRGACLPARELLRLSSARGADALSIDFRHDTALADMGACDVAPSSGDLGIADARVIAPERRSAPC